MLHMPTRRTLCHLVKDNCRLVRCSELNMRRGKAPTGPVGVDGCGRAWSGPYLDLELQLRVDGIHHLRPLHGAGAFVAVPHHLRTKQLQLPPSVQQAAFASRRLAAENSQGETNIISMSFCLATLRDRQRSFLFNIL